MARPSKAVMAAKAKSKALLASDWQSSVPGVFFIAVGEPRWAARIRWQKDNAVYRDKTHVWKLSISPKTGGYTEKDRRSQESSATRDLNSAISFPIASCGVAHPNVFLGRPFISEAT